MALDINKAKKKLKKQRPMGVSLDGKLTEENPRNDGTDEHKQGHTTLLPQKHFIA
ncbi:MAG: hypothetical protein HON76_08485 [Candidatus Scalindua sp.]|jgi:hypothetical protein|nr:hypothetical protein [Candidatus Scalindua sp.]